MNIGMRAALVALGMWHGAIFAAEPAAGAVASRAQLEGIRATVVGLVEALVAQGALTRAAADGILEQARLEGERAAAAAQAADAGAASPGEVRVSYVPEFVKDEIRAQVREDLRKEVVGDVLAHAKDERWGIPDALPEWTRNISLSGDLRVRAQSDVFAKTNAPFTYFDFLAINDAGSLSGAGVDAFQNTTEDRYRGRLRARLGLDAAITQELKAGFRLATGNTRDPVSTNQTLGNTGNRYQTVLDQAYLRYQTAGPTPTLSAVAGRFPNPWFSTDLVYDSDLGFEGAALTYRPGFLPRQAVFATVGAFPLQEVALSGDDKWLFGGQLGFDWAFPQRSRLRAGLAYYDFHKMHGVRNAFGLSQSDFTAPDYLQKGNTLFDIRNDADPDTFLFALASDYNLANVTAELDLGHFDPVHVVLTADYVRNVGFDQDAVFERTGFDVDPRVDGYQLLAALGWLKVDTRGAWRVFGGWRHLERDAVLDAFTDSDFHLGGTDAEGWTLGWDYGLARNTWLTMRYLSADEIDGPPLGIDVVQFDLNTRF